MHLLRTSDRLEWPSSPNDDMTIEQIREKVIAAYPSSKTWAARVSRMSDGQVYAIYSRLSQKGVIK